jgi:hypothetical protein
MTSCTNLFYTNKVSTVYIKKWLVVLCQPFPQAKLGCTIYSHCGFSVTTIFPIYCTTRGNWSVCVWVGGALWQLHGWKLCLAIIMKKHKRIENWKQLQKSIFIVNGLFCTLAGWMYKGEYRLHVAIFDICSAWSETKAGKHCCEIDIEILSCVNTPILYSLSWMLYPKTNKQRVNNIYFKCTSNYWQ